MGYKGTSSKNCMISTATDALQKILGCVGTMKNRNARTGLIQWGGLMVLCAGLLSGCTSLGGSGITSAQFAQGRSQNWEIALTRLKVLEAQEDRSLLGVPISDGDEPYIIMFGFKSRFGMSGSTEIQGNRFEDDDWADHLKAGQQRNIPVAMGSLRFNDVGAGEVVGVVVLAMESDRTPWAIIRNRVEEVEADLLQAVAREVESRREPDLETTAFIDNLHQTMQESVQPIAKPLTRGQALENIVFSGVDTDEVIGVNSLIFMKRPPSRSLQYPHYRQPYLTDIFENRDFVFNNNALVFQNNSLGARYEAELRVRQF